MSYSTRPHLSSYQYRVRRRDRLKVVLPFLLVFAIGFGVAWVVKPAQHVISTASGCTYSQVIPAKVLPHPSAITVNVYNATKRVGLASLTSVDLRTRGFKSGIVASSSENIKGIAEIRYGAGFRPAANRLAAYVPGGVVKRDATKKPGDSSVDLIIGDSFGQLAPDQQVSAILAIPSAQASGKGCPRL